MAQHTPGPWVWDGDYTLRPASPDPRRHALHTILSPEGTYGFVQTSLADTEPEWQACKRLIAAAPDLLAALRSMRDAVRITRACLMDSVETHGTHGGWLHDEARRLMAEEAIADAAIAAATEAQS